ncbi:MAG TPA: hypothetical protein VK601_09375, partial [Kofleriaceae bacterium]|nr:hypothetical protein [Kofleriaceae bacterium]
IYKVDDLARAKTFYSTVTGRAPYFDEPFYVGYDVDGFELGLDPDVSTQSPGTGGTGQFSAVRIFTLRRGNVVELGEILGGDRGDGGIRRVAVDGGDGGAIVVDRNVLAEGDGACCASTWRRERWIWRDGAPVEDVAARGALLPVP